MGGICVRETEEQVMLREHNTKIRDIIREETTELRAEHRWADLIFRRLSHLRAESLFQQSFERDIKRFRRNNESLYVRTNPNTNSIKLPLPADSLEDDFKNSCLIPEDEFTREGDITAEDATANSKPIIQDMSFNDKVARNPSMVMQMSIIYKSEFMEQRNFNNSVKRFLKWSQIAEQHLQHGFLLVLYRLFAAELMRDLQEGSEVPLRVLLANINESCTKFIHMMNRLYSGVYELEAVKKEACGELFKYENLFNFTMTNLFRNSELMKTLRQVIHRKLEPQIELLGSKIRLLQAKPLSYFQISPEFLPAGESTSSEASERIGDELTHPSNAGPVYFQLAIARLLDVGKASTPIGKVKSILLASKQIVNEITRFYQGRGRTPPNLDPDTVTSIMMYIIVQTNFPELVVDIQIIEDFSTRNCMNCVSGYYLQVIKACFEMISQAKC